MTTGPSKRTNQVPKGDSISFTVRQPNEVKVELVHGSIKRLKVESGDLLVVRIDGRMAPDVHAKVLDRICEIMESTSVRATTIVVPSDFDFEQIPHNKAVELLQDITAKGKATNGNGT